MGFFSDLFDSITGRGKAKEASRAAREANALADEYQDTAYGELGRFERGYSQLEDFFRQLGGQQGSRIGRFGGLLMDEADSRFGRDRFNDRANTAYLKNLFGDIDRSFQGSLATSNTAAANSKRVAQRTYDDTVRNATAGLEADLRRRGLGGSTNRESTISSAIIPNALGGLLSANASIDSALADRTAQLESDAAQAKLAGGNILNSRFGQEGQLSLSRDQDFLNRLASVYGQQLDNQSRTDAAVAGARQAPLDFRANRTVHSGLLYPNRQFVPDVGGLGSFLGNTLSGPIQAGIGAAVGGPIGALGTQIGNYASNGLNTLFGSSPTSPVFNPYAQQGYFGPAY